MTITHDLNVAVLDDEVVYRLDLAELVADAMVELDEDADPAAVLTTAIRSAVVQAVAETTRLVDR